MWHIINEYGSWGKQMNQTMAPKEDLKIKETAWKSGNQIVYIEFEVLDIQVGICIWKKQRSSK